MIRNFFFFLFFFSAKTHHSRKHRNNRDYWVSRIDRFANHIVVHFRETQVSKKIQSHRTFYYVSIIII